MSPSANARPARPTATRSTPPRLPEGGSGNTTPTDATDQGGDTHQFLHHRHREHGLAGAVLNTLELFAQSLAATGPSIATAGMISFTFTVAGNGTALAFVIGTTIVFLVGIAVAQFARRAVSSGSLYSYAAEGLGRPVGFGVAWSLVLGYLFMAAATIAGAALFGTSLLNDLGVHASGRGWSVALILVATAIAGTLPLLGVRLSVRVAIALEIASLLVILVVLGITLVHFGARFDTAQFTARGVSLNTVLSASVLAVTTFVGFESAGSLGSEARSPFRTVPKAVLATVLGAGILYVVASYVLTIGFTTSQGLATDASPLNAIVREAGVSWLGGFLDAGVTVSALACASASLAAAARVLFSLGREHALPSRLGDAHPRWHTPHVALAVLTPIAGLVPAVYALRSVDLFTIFGDVAAFSTYGYLVAYAVVAAAAPVYLRRIGAAWVTTAVTSTLAVLAIAFVIYKNVYPQPAYPLSVLPYVYLGALLLGLAWYGVLHLRAPERARRLGGLTVHAEPRRIDLTVAAGAPVAEHVAAG